VLSGEMKMSVGWLLVGGLLVSSACHPPPPRPMYSVADRGADRDNDGAADLDDACPETPEDGLPPRANDGCPADDPDQDSIARAEDDCPNAKEDGIAPKPDDGCPTDDTDGDGVANAKDRCESGLEDNLAPNPSDGCPSPDGDRDGIADSSDGCVGQAEVVNGYRDDDGCPDDVPSGGAVAYDETSYQIYVPNTRKIEFDTDSANLTAAAKETVADVARALMAHPEISRVEIEVHASTKGDESHNSTLTHRRSMAVATALLSHGISADRLVPIGYGEYCPAVVTTDDIDEPRNRRVLLKAVTVNGVWQSVSRGCWRARTKGIDPAARRPGVSAQGAGTAQPPTSGGF